jgi:hypothetical protein
LTPAGIAKLVLEAIHVVADIFTIVASGIAIYLFIAKRGQIAAAFQVLLNYSYQTTLGELTQKLERLNEYRANEPQDVHEIRNIMHEIAGQMKGNSTVAAAAATLIPRVEAFAAAKRITEPAKRALTAEIREVLRNMNVGSVEDYLGK